MKKRRKTGFGHYRERLGLKPILVYVKKGVHKKLLKHAVKDGSLQKLARRILQEYVNNQ